MTETPALLPKQIHALIDWLKGLRYIKFGMVGATGTLVNMAVLFIAQEYLFSAIQNPRERLYASLALAIGIATINNFTWNRLWTWADRFHADTAKRDGASTTTRANRVLGQLARYALASWLGIALQYGLTLWLANHLHYLVANVIAILVASISNFLANDRWTFRRGRQP